VTLPRPLAHLLALLLGVAAALLVACGGGTDDGIPSANAGDLKSQIEDVQQAVDSGRCSDVYGQLKQVDERIDDLPPSTDPQLVRSLRDGADTLRGVAIEECDATPANTTTETTTQTETETTPVETTTTPTDTTTTATPTTTVPPTTTPTTPVPPPLPEPPAPQPPPPAPPTGTPGGGVEPDLP
jgi:cell division protein FtsN